VAQRLLVVDHMVPAPDRDSGSASALSRLQILRRAGYDVTFIAPNVDLDRPYPRALRDLGFTVPRVDGPGHMVELVTSLAPTFDAALLSRAPIAIQVFDRIREITPATRVVFLPVDLHHVRMAREAAVHGLDDPEVEQMRAVEVHLVHFADATIVASTTEQELLQALVPHAAVHVLPLLREVPARSPAEEAAWRTRRTLHRLGPVGRRAFARTPDVRRRRDIVFIGSFAHSPNIDAVHWFVDAVLPLVRTAGVTDRFVVAGHGVPDSVAALARDDIAVAGWVPDLAPLFRTARMSVVPLRSGAGFKGKIVSSLSHGVPVVSTSVGAEGGGLVDGRDVLVGDSPAGLAAQIVRLSRDDDLWQDMAEASYETFETRFSHDAGGGRLLAIIAGLLGG
jgi:glycosyltransferase involved in cell wall biosynthesis